MIKIGDSLVMVSRRRPTRRDGCILSPLCRRYRCDVRACAGSGCDVMLDQRHKRCSWRPPSGWSRIRAANIWQIATYKGPQPGALAQLFTLAPLALRAKPSPGRYVIGSDAGLCLDSLRQSGPDERPNSDLQLRGTRGTTAWARLSLVLCKQLSYYLPNQTSSLPSTSRGINNDKSTRAMRVRWRSLLILSAVTWLSERRISQLNSRPPARKPTNNNKKEKEVAEKKVTALLEQIVGEVQPLKLPENRIRVQIAAADMLWKRNEARARSMSSLAGDGVAELIACHTTATAAVGRAVAARAGVERRPA